MSDLAAYIPPVQPFNEQMPNFPTPNSRDDYLFQTNNISTKLGRVAVNTVMLTGNAETKIQNIFKVIGFVKVLSLTADITMQLGNCTVSSVIFKDDSATVDITESVTGTILSNAGVGSFLIVKEDNTAAISLSTATQVRYTSTPFSFILQQKNGTDSYISFQYTTSDTPTTGKIQFRLTFVPLTDESGVIMP
jgi:hypothetical protein